MTTIPKWAVALGMMLFLSVAATPAFATEGGIGIRLVDIPESSASNPRARLYIVDHLAPGTAITRRMEISNTSSDAVDVLAYAAAATIDDGSFVGSKDRTVNELSQWTTVTPETLTLDANSDGIATVTVAVPADAAPGEYYGVVWAEAGSATSSESGVPKTGVVMVNRVGILMYISVGPGGAPAADFTITSLRPSRSANGSPVVAATVVNTGGRALDLAGSLTLTDGPGGLTAGPFDATFGVTLGIGSTEDVRIVLNPQVPDGPWTAEITLASGLTERSATATITFPPTGSDESVIIDPGSASGILKFVAVAAVVIATVLLFAYLLTIWITRRRRRQLRASGARPGTRSL